MLTGCNYTLTFDPRYKEETTRLYVDTVNACVRGSLKIFGRLTVLTTPPTHQGDIIPSQRGIYT